jgi:hypothetical protein
MIKEIFESNAILKNSRLDITSYLNTVVEVEKQVVDLFNLKLKK